MATTIPTDLTSEENGTILAALDDWAAMPHQKALSTSMLLGMVGIASRSDKGEDERVADIEARLKAATPGPWRWKGNHNDVYLQSQVSLSVERPFHETVLSASAEATGQYETVDADLRFNVDGIMVDAARLAIRPQSHNPWFIDGVDHPDAAFIAAAPTDIADLLAEVRRLREQFQKARKAARP